MFVFQSVSTLSANDSQKTRTQLWGEFDQAVRANSAAWVQESSARIGREYSKISDPVPVREACTRLFEFLYAQDASGAYAQNPMSPTTLVNIVSVMMQTTSNCAQVRAEFFGAPDAPAGQLQLARDGLTHTDSVVLQSQKRLLDMAVDWAAVSALSSSTSRVLRTAPADAQDSIRSLGILLNHLGTGENLYSFQESRSKFAPYVSSLQALLESSNLNLVNSAAALLGRIDYDSNDPSLKAVVKASLVQALSNPALVQTAATNPNLATATRKTLLWALNGPAGLASVPAPGGLALPTLDPLKDPTDVYASLYGFINASGQYAALMEMKSPSVYQPLPFKVPASVTDAESCAKFLEGLRVYFEGADIDANVALSAEERTRKKQERWDFARRPQDGLMVNTRVSLADYTLMVLNAISRNLVESPSDELRALTNKITLLRAGTLGTLASSKLLASASGSTISGVDPNSNGAASSFNTVQSGALRIVTPLLDFPKQSQRASTDEAVHGATPQNTLSTSNKDMATTTSEYGQFAQAFKDYLTAQHAYASGEGPAPDPSQYTSQGAFFADLVANANQGDFVGGIAGKREAIALAAAGKISEAIDLLSANSALMQDLIHSGIITKTQLTLFAKMGPIQFRLNNPYAWQDFFTWKGLSDTRHKFAYFPMYLDVSTTDLMGALIETRTLYDPDKKNFYDVDNVKWKDTGTRYNLDHFAVVCLPIPQLGNWSSWGVTAGLSVGNNLLKGGKMEFQEARLGVQRPGAGYGRVFVDSPIDPYASISVRPKSNYTATDATGLKSVISRFDNLYTVGADVYLPNLPLWGYVFQTTKVGVEQTMGEARAPETKFKVLFATRPIADAIDLQFNISPDYAGLVGKQVVINEFQVAARLKTKPLLGQDWGDLSMRASYNRLADGVQAQMATAGFNATPWSMRMEYSLNLASIQHNFSNFNWNWPWK